MKIITDTAPHQNCVVEFTGAELKRFFKKHGSYFICSSISQEYKKKFGVEMFPTSESVILAVRKAVPSRFRKTPPKSCENVLNAWLLQKYSLHPNSRMKTIMLVPDDYVFTIPMFTTRQQ